MKDFYIRLREEIEAGHRDLWSETVLSGERAGEKTLFCGSSDSAAGENSGNAQITESLQGERVFRERIGTSPELIICGGGHVSIPIIQMGQMIGFRVTVLEDRPKFADNARAAGADEVLCEPFADGLAKIKGGQDSWFVIVTRGHRYDTECLEHILHKDYAYVGMMGSRRRVAIVKDQLEERGLSREQLEGVHTPIGLKIKAETPEEIAVSVMAEIIQVKNSTKKAGAYSAEFLAALFGESKKQKVAATIISRKGSAPRSVGTKMMILEDGRTVDTIGGGCVESEIIQKALLMMRMKKSDFEICRVDMTADAAEDEGMVCGGVVEVMLERIEGR